MRLPWNAIHEPHPEPSSDPNTPFSRYPTETTTGMARGTQTRPTRSLRGRCSSSRGAPFSRPPCRRWSSGNCQPCGRPPAPPACASSPSPRLSCTFPVPLTSCSLCAACALRALPAPRAQVEGVRHHILRARAVRAAGRHRLRRRGRLLRHRLEAPSVVEPHSSATECAVAIHSQRRGPQARGTTSSA